MKPEHAVDLFNIISFIFTILLLFGLLQTKSVLFEKISFMVKIAVGIVLIFKFNDFYPSKHFTVFDRKICFLAGTFILAFTVGDFISKNAFNEIKTILNEAKQF